MPVLCGVFQDFFFYSLVYDPQQKTLLADKGEIRVGNRYQADITDLLKEGEVQAGPGGRMLEVVPVAGTSVTLTSALSTPPSLGTLESRSKSQTQEPPVEPL